MSVNQKRKDKRHELPHSIQVYNSFSGEKLGALVNLSKNGLMMAGNQALMVDTLYQLTLKFSEPFCGVAELHVGVDCLWVDHAESQGQLFFSGCHVIDISEEHDQDLDLILHAIEAAEAKVSSV